MPAINKMIEDLIEQHNIIENWDRTVADEGWCEAAGVLNAWPKKDRLLVSELRILWAHPKDLEKLYNHYVLSTKKDGKSMSTKATHEITSDTAPTNSLISRAKGYLLAFAGWLKSMTSGTFEAIGKGIDSAKRFLTDNIVFSTAKRFYRFVKSFINNPKCWLLKLLGVGAFHKELLDMALMVVNYLMKLAKEWLPESAYNAIERVYCKVVELGMRIWKALTDNRPARFFKRLVGAMFGWVEKAKAYVKGLIRRKMTEALV